MKLFVKPKYLPWFTLLVGMIGFLLRVWLYAGIDEKGLLPNPHISNALLCILVAVTLVVLFLIVRRFCIDGSYPDCFPRSIIGGLGYLAAAAGIVILSLCEIRAGLDFFDWVTIPAGLLATIALVFCVKNRFQGTCPAFYLYVVICVYFMLHAVSQCRSWGTEPQLTSYGFQLMASIFLMLSAYQLCAVSISKANCRWLLFTTQAALFFCCLSLNTENFVLYLSMAIWMATNTCRLQEV